MDRKILTYDSVEISFGGKAVVHDVSFSLEHGEILGLVGESGSGKSTLIKAAMGLLGPDGLVTRGDIRYMNQNILIHISDISSCHKTIRSQKSHCGFDQGAFPTAGFSHKAKYLSMFKREAHIMNHRFPAK